MLPFLPLFHSFAGLRSIVVLSPVCSVLSIFLALVAYLSVAAQLLFKPAYQYLAVRKLRCIYWTLLSHYGISSCYFLRDFMKDLNRLSISVSYFRAESISCAFSCKAFWRDSAPYYCAKSLSLSVWNAATGSNAILLYKHTRLNSGLSRFIASLPSACSSFYSAKLCQP